MNNCYNTGNNERPTYHDLQCYGRKKGLPPIADQAPAPVPEPETEPVAVQPTAAGTVESAADPEKTED